MAIIRGQGLTSKPKDAYIATEGLVLCKVPIQQVPFVLLSTYYVFNMQYSHGCSNFFSFLEFLFLGIKPPKRTKLQHFITGLTNVDVI